MRVIRYVAAGLLAWGSVCMAAPPAGGESAGKKAEASAAGTKEFDRPSMMPGMMSPPLLRFSDKNASTELIDHAIPVIPKTVEEFSFSGKPLAAKDPVQIFGGPRVTAEMEPDDRPRR